MKLEVAVADISQSKKDLTIEVAADEVAAEFEKAYQTFARHAKVPGFRPGHVPRGVVKQRFGKEIKDEVVGRLLPHALQHAIEDHKLQVVGQPHVDDISLTEGQPLTFKASIEVMPQFELQPYQGLKATKQVTKVTDEDVAGVIEKWRESAAEFVPVEDRPSAQGDFVSFDLVGKHLEPADAPEIKLENTQVELGSPNVQPEFDEHLRGVRAGDAREFRVVYPENHEGRDFAGKTVDFSVKVLAIRCKELPELDDDFVKGLGEYETLEQAREKVREKLVKEAEHRAGLRLRDQLLTEILKSYDFEIPASLVEEEAVNRVREVAYLMLRSGVDPSMIKNLDWEERLPRARVEAVRDIRAALVVGRIATAEGVKIAQEELDAELERIAASSGEPLAQLKARLTKEESLSSIENRLIYQKALDLVAKSAEITVEELTPGELARREQPETEIEKLENAQTAENS